MWLYLRVKYRLLRQEFMVRRRYYSNKTFRAIDHAFRKAYRFKNPYTLSRKFLEKKEDKEVHLYGETYLATYETIGKACGLTAHDRMLEMGSGRGRGVFFLATFFGARVHGVEWIPQFVGIAQAIASKCACKEATFSCEDFMHTDLRGYTVIYLYGTSLKDEEIKRLCARFQSLPKGVQIVTVSYPLTEYSASFTIKKELKAPYLWGEATIYIQEVTSPLTQDEVT